MAISPASRGRPSSPTHSDTKTRRSTVSTAFQTSGTSATAPTITNSPVQYGTATSMKEQSMSKKVGSPVSMAQKELNIVSVGTVTNPDATAAELLAVKSPHLTSGSFRGPSASGTVNKMSSVNANPLVAAIGPAGAAGVNSQTGPASGSGLASQMKAPASTSIAKQPETTVADSSMADGQVSSAVGVQPAVGHGIIDVTNRTGAYLEMIFSGIAGLLFAALWVYMLGFAGCFRDDTWIFLTKAFAAFGVIASLFVLFHSCFERRITIGRGVFGCIIFFAIAVVTFLNIVDAFMAMNCLCRCSSGANAFSVGQSEDLTIFFLSLTGAFALIAVLLVSSVVHGDQHRNHRSH